MMEREGTFSCPICGLAEPHAHTDAEIQRDRNRRLPTNDRFYVKPGGGGKVCRMFACIGNSRCCADSSDDDEFWRTCKAGIAGVQPDRVPASEHPLLKPFDDPETAALAGEAFDNGKAASGVNETSDETRQGGNDANR